MENCIKHQGYTDKTNFLPLVASLEVESELWVSTIRFSLLILRQHDSLTYQEV